MKKVLVVVDMQNDFVDGSLGTPEAVAIVDNVVRKIENFDGNIIVTYDTHTQNYSQTREGKYLPVPHCIADSDGWKLNPKVEAALANKDVQKLYKPSFGDPVLIDMLDEHLGDVNFDEHFCTVEFVGLCTDICVVSNALLLKAAFPEMDITVDASCCAGVTKVKHEAALEVMRSCQINVIGGEA